MRVMVFSDGSAHSPVKDGGIPPAGIGGWCSVVAWEEASQVRTRVFTGSECPTTITRCELTPILRALSWISSWNHGSSPNLDIACVSDSEFVVKTLSGQYKAPSRYDINDDLWFPVFDLVKQVKAPTRLRFIWRERNTHPAMSYCDNVAGLMYDGAKSLMARYANAYAPEATSLNLPLSLFEEFKEASDVF